MIRRLSLQARFLLVALASSLAALAFASVAISDVLEHFVVRSLDERLDTQIAALANAVGPKGEFQADRLVLLPGFAASEPGWSWSLRSPAGQWNGGATIVEEHFNRHWRHHNPGGAVSGEGRTLDDIKVHLRRAELSTPYGMLDVVAAGPRDLVDRPLWTALGTLVLSVGLLALGLVIASWLQIRIGLQPIRDLQSDVSKVRSGARAQLPSDQPKELKPLADEVNALIAQNQEGLEHARRHVANLAHGLKTPLATLTMRLDREGATTGTRQILAQLDSAIAHHLRRARSAAPMAAGRATANVLSTVADLVGALEHIHVERRLAVDILVDAETSVAVDRRDLEEMLGNLLDNAYRHAHTRIGVVSSVEGRSVIIEITDDGPGLSEVEIQRATDAGVRIDESGVGYGFGLTIVRELAEMYGGQLVLASLPKSGGLSAQVQLPRSLP